LRDGAVAEDRPEVGLGGDPAPLDDGVHAAHLLGIREVDLALVAAADPVGAGEEEATLGAAAGVADLEVGGDRDPEVAVEHLAEDVGEGAGVLGARARIFVEGGVHAVDERGGQIAAAPVLTQRDDGQLRVGLEPAQRASRGTPRGPR
jgi:hypothetical protein